MTSLKRIYRAIPWMEGEEEFYRQKLIGRTLHVCCGTSKLGDVRVDISVDYRPHVVATLRRLPFKDKSFDTVIADPPWINQYYLWLAEELPRVARRRIIVVTNHFWYEPRRTKHRGWYLEGIYIIKGVSPVVKLAFVWDYKAPTLSPYLFKRVR